MSTNYKTNPEKYVKESPFPNMELDPAKKKKKEYGAKIGKAIHAMYIQQSNTGHYDRIRRNRLYAVGKQDVDQYKKVINPDVDEVGSKNWVNISHENVPMMPKFINVIVGDMINQEMKPQFNAIDSKSHTRREEARDEFYANLYRWQASESIEMETGMQLDQRDPNMPQNQEEIEIHMELEYKEDIEIGMEQIVDFELYNNDYENISKRIKRDFVENNRGITHVYFDETNHIRLEYVDLEKYIQSASDDPASKDCEYYGVIKGMTVRELRRRAGTDLEEKDLFYIAKNSGGINKDRDWNYGDVYYEGETDYQFDDYMVEVLEFVYYTQDTLTYRYKENKYGGHYMDKKGYNWNAPKSPDAKKKKLAKTVEMEYTGLYIPTCEKVVAYGPSKSIIRERKEGEVNPECIRRFISFEPNKRYGSSTSMVEKMIPIEDEIQGYIRKMRQFVAESIPPGGEIDISAIAHVSESIKGMNSPMDVISLFKQKGILVYDGTDRNGDPRNARAVNFAENGFGAGLRPFMDGIAFQIEQLRNVTGINEARDATTPDSKALVGIQKLQLINSNNATREIYEGYLQVYKGICSVIGNMVQDKAYLRGGLKEYENIIGKLGVKSIEVMREEISHRSLGIKVEVLPGEQELERLSQDLNIEIQQGTLGIEDKQEILRMTNVKKAERLMRFRKKKLREQKMQEQAMQEENIAQREERAAAASAQAEMQKNQSRMEAEIAIMTKAHEFKMAEIQAEGDQKLRVVNMQGDNKLEEIEKAGQMRLDESEGSKAAPDPRVFPGTPGIE